MRLKLAAVALLTVLAAGCSDEEAVTEPWPADWQSALTKTLVDPAADLVQLAPGQGAPQYVVAYPPVDVKRIEMGVREDFLYLRIVFAGAVPSAPQHYSDDGAAMEAQTVAQHNVNLVMDVDGDDGTGFSGEGVAGIDLLFGVVFHYGGSVSAYAIYDFPPVDEPRGEQTGESEGGGAGHDFIHVRHRLSSLGAFNPAGKAVEIGGWAEAESDRYHHFAFDSLAPGSWSVP